MFTNSQESINSTSWTSDTSSMQHQVKCLKNDTGFSIPELMIAAAIGMIVILALAGGVQMVSKANKKAQTDSMEIAEMAVVGANFPAFVQQARPSVDFLHQPVNKSCAGSDTVPCLRMEVNGEFQELDSTTLGQIAGNTVEFYRDASGELHDNLKLSKTKAHAGPATLTYTSGLNLSKLPSNHTVYATWPMIDENSPPLIMMTGNTIAKFSVPGYTGASEPDESQWLFLKLDSGQLADVSSLKDMPIAFVNANDTRQYVIKYVADVHSCGDSSWVAVCNTAATKPVYVNANDIIVKYATITPSDLASLTATGVVPPSDGNFDPGFSSLSLFPNISTTIADTEAVYFSGSSFDPRRQLHYYHGEGMGSSLAALPVALMSMRVIKNGTKYNLVRDVYRHGQTPIRGDVSTDLQGPALIARKLGTKEIKLILFGNTPAL